MASITNDAVTAATGKGWDEWFAVLDKAGAKAFPHKQIVGILDKQHGVTSWWRQMVTVEYERSRGLRAKHQTNLGFSITSTKTLGISVAKAYKAWSPQARRAWLDAGALTVRTAIPNKS